MVKEEEQRSSLVCEFCEYTPGQSEHYDKAIDGWWCEDCDAFNFYNSFRAGKDRFIVLLEDKALAKPTIIKPPVKLKKNLSPLRFPGGKSKIIDYLYAHVSMNKTHTLYSAFSGGASFELALLESNTIERLVLNDKDYGIYSLWWSIIYAPFTLIERIKNETPSSKDYYKAQYHLANDGRGLTMSDAAWYTLIVNRLAFSGIAKANHMGGKNGSTDKMLSRWNPATLIKRIEAVHQLADRIEIHCEDATDFIKEAYWSSQTIFIDPPYIENGKFLYNHYFDYEQHKNLSHTLDALYWGFSGADILITYDNHKLTNELFYQATEVKIIGTQYSI